MPLHEQDIDRASALFDVNIKGVFYCMKFEIEQMLKTGGGAMVNTSSIFGLNGYPGWSLYVATKHAVTGMTKAAALDYAKRNIRVNAVGPGPVETPLLAKGTGGDPHSYAAFVPMGRIGQPDEIAAPWSGCCPTTPGTLPAIPSRSMAACAPSECPKSAEPRAAAGGTGGLPTSAGGLGHWWASHQCHPAADRGIDKANRPSGQITTYRGRPKSAIIGDMEPTTITQSATIGCLTH